MQIHRSAGMIQEMGVQHMDCSKVGRLILTLRREKGMTQKTLAESLHVSDRTISKWERGIGCPDVSLLGQLSALLEVNVEKILAGDLELNHMDQGNMKKIKFYLCPDCGNIVCCTGEAEISCCGRKRAPLLPRTVDEAHTACVQTVDDECYITLEHEMTKEHYITFAAYVTYDKVLWVKLYPEQAAEIRFPRLHGGTLYLCCNRDGLMCCGKV